MKSRRLFIYHIPAPCVINEHFIIIINIYLLMVLALCQIFCYLQYIQLVAEKIIIKPNTLQTIINL